MEFSSESLKDYYICGNRTIYDIFKSNFDVLNIFVLHRRGQNITKLSKSTIIILFFKI